jgi:hypothetical protein
MIDQLSGSMRHTEVVDLILNILAQLGHKSPKGKMAKTFSAARGVLKAKAKLESLTAGDIAK